MAGRFFFFFLPSYGQGLFPPHPFSGNCASTIFEICELFNGNCASAILEICKLFNGNCANIILEICIYLMEIV